MFFSSPGWCEACDSGCELQSRAAGEGDEGTGEQGECSPVHALPSCTNVQKWTHRVLYHYTNPTFVRLSVWPPRSPEANRLKRKTLQN